MQFNATVSSLKDCETFPYTFKQLVKRGSVTQHIPIPADLFRTVCATTLSMPYTIKLFPQTRLLGKFVWGLYLLLVPRLDFYCFAAFFYVFSEHLNKASLHSAIFSPNYGPSGYKISVPLLSLCIVFCWQ